MIALSNQVIENVMEAPVVWYHVTEYIYNIYIYIYIYTDIYIYIYIYMLRPDSKLDQF